MEQRTTPSRFERTELLIGAEGLATLRRARVAVAGIGGVGSFVTEALARAGIGWLVLIDYDDVEITNTNRQIHAMAGNYGRPKVEVMAERIKAINPDCITVTWKEFIREENLPLLLHGALSYVVDAVDTVSAKIALIKYAVQNEIPVIAAMGAGNKLDPKALKVADISATHTCPLAKAVRKSLRDHGITTGVKVVFSTEPPVPLHQPPPSAGPAQRNCTGCPSNPAGCACPRKRQVPGSISYLPSIMGLMIAGEVIQDLLKKGKDQ